LSESNQLTLLPAASLASLTVLPGSSEAQKMTVTSGRNLGALLHLLGPLGYFAKMCLESEGLYSTRCLLIWSIWVTPRGYPIFRLRPLTLHTGANEFSLWPTPSATDWHSANCGQHHAARGMKRLRLNHFCFLLGRPDLAKSPEFREQLMGFPIGYTDLEHLETP